MSMKRQIPKNVRQIGNVSDSSKIYVEDYVISYMKQMNKDVRTNNIDIKILQNEFVTFNCMLYILGLRVSLKPLTKEEKDVVLAWQEARKNKDFENADILRNKINELGIRL